MRYSRPFLIAMLASLLAMLTALGFMAPRMYPLHTDTPANFWYATTGVNLGGGHGFADAVVFDRDRFVYGSEGRFYPYDDYPYETISLAEAEKEFPAVQKELARRAALNDPDDVPAAGYGKWTTSGPYRVTIAALIQCIDQAHREQIVAHGWGFGYLDFQRDLGRVGDAARWYYATVIFEALLFGGLIVFGFWPFIRRQSVVRKYVHVALLPVMLYLPMWLGYCNSASPAFPIGGVLYPYMERLAPLDNYEWEFCFLAKLPPFFSAITQGRTVTYAEYFRLRNSVPHQIGPVTVLAMTGVVLALAATVHTCVWLVRRKRGRRAAFPVVGAGLSGGEAAAIGRAGG